MKRLYTACALVCVLGFSALAQNSAPAPAPAGQIVPGNTGSISPDQGVSPAVVAPSKMMDGALSSHTRQTLQEAMNSMYQDGSKAGDVVTIIPGQGAELDGDKTDVVDFDMLPDSVKGALGSDVQQALHNGAGR